MEAAVSASTRFGTIGDVRRVSELDSLEYRGSSRRRQIEAAAREGTLIVAEVEDEIAGYAVIDYAFFQRGFVALVVVASRHRRRGIGLQLLRAARRMCRTGTLFTSTNASNLAAQSLFEAAGFKRAGVVENLEPGDPELIYCVEVNRHDR